MHGTPHRIMQRIPQHLDPEYSAPYSATFGYRIFPAVFWPLIRTIWGRINPAPNPHYLGPD